MEARGGPANSPTQQALASILLTRLLESGSAAANNRARELLSTEMTSACESRRASTVSAAACRPAPKMRGVEWRAEPAASLLECRLSTAFVRYVERIAQAAQASGKMGQNKGQKNSARLRSFRKQLRGECNDPCAASSSRRRSHTIEHSQRASGPQARHPWS